MVSSWILLLALVRLSSAAVAPFPYEQVVLDPSDEAVQKYPELLSFDKAASTEKCRVIPGDKGYPSEDVWETVSELVEGRLVSPPPIANPCYTGSSYSANECEVIVRDWSLSTLHDKHPTSIMNPLYSGLSCLPTTDPNKGNCTQGTYPPKVINVETVRDIQIGVLVAKNQNLRLVIKNTGHDFLGRSTGKGALSIRTHALKDIEFLEEFKSEAYTGPAFKLASGVQVQDVYKAANKLGYIVVGGAGTTVGIAGGYSQGGGHSPLSVYGLASDNILEHKVVTADGKLVTANASENPELYWALRGGGGSTFGVVVSIVVRAYKEVPVTGSSFVFHASPADFERAAAGDKSWKDFWSVIRTYLTLFPAHADAGIWSDWRIRPYSSTENISFSMEPYVAVNKTVEEVTALLKPVVDAGEAVGIKIDINATTFPTFYDSWLNIFPLEVMGNWNQQAGSRLVSGDNWKDAAKFNQTFEALHSTVQDDGSIVIGFNTAPRLQPGNVEPAAHPAWRETIFFAFALAQWDIELRDLNEINAIRKEFTDVKEQPWREVSSLGSYLNEANVNEPDFQQVFWGGNYPRLLQVKEKWDPTGVFYADAGVGSEKFTTGADRLGRLCKA